MIPGTTPKPRAKPTAKPTAKGKPAATSFSIPTVDAQYTTGKTPGVPYPDVKPVGGGTDGKAPTQVSTEALKTYSANLRTLSDSLKKVWDKLDAAVQQPIQPGYFYEAKQLSDRVNADASTGAGGTSGGVVPVTQAFVGTLITALNQTVDGLNQLAAKYTKAEDLNNVSAQKLNELMSTAENSIQTVTGSTVPLTPTPSDSSTSGSGTSGSGTSGSSTSGSGTSGSGTSGSGASSSVKVVDSGPQTTYAGGHPLLALSPRLREVASPVLRDQPVMAAGVRISEQALIG